MEFQVKVDGLDRVAKRGPAIVRAVEQEIAKGLYASGLHVEREAKQAILTGGKSGLVYEKYRPRRTHQASAPGEAPASDTGRLVNSIRTESDPKEARVRAGGVARKLELGTAKMAARPFLFPALEKSKAWIRARLRRAVQAGLK